MIAKLPGAKQDGRGRSFKSLIRYILHDKNRATTSRRLAWAETINCGLGGDLRRAWYEMMLTWENRTALKRAHGLAETGRSNQRPVLHLTLSWHPSETPDREEMMDAAMSVLDWLELDEHQAVVAAHNDEPHPHLHLAINTVHPTTGKTANLYQCKKALSDWAMHWEETHGGIIVENRARNRLDALDRPRSRPPSMPFRKIAAIGHPLVAPGAAGNDNAAPSPAPRRRHWLTLQAVPRLHARFRRAAAQLVALSPLLLLFARPDATGPPTVTMRPPSPGAQPSAACSPPRRRRHWLGLRL